MLKIQLQQPMLGQFRVCTFVEKKKHKYFWIQYKLKKL